MSEEEKRKIQQFIGSVTEKNYAQANKYLKEVLDSKMGSRIAQVTNKPIFK